MEDGENVSLPSLNEKPVVIYFCPDCSKQGKGWHPEHQNPLIRGLLSMYECVYCGFCCISVTFVSKDGEEILIQVPIAMSVLEAAHENGACEGSLACSTCNVIVMDMEYYNKLEDPSDEENEMLDLAFGLKETMSNNRKA